MPLGAVRAALLGIKKGIQGILIGPTSIATYATASTATAYPNQRKIDRTSNGVLWTISLFNAQTVEAHYSLNDGATWNFGGSVFSTSGSTYVGNASLFIDQDDYAHVVYKNSSSGYIYHKRGTPNAARTSWTWSGESLLSDTAIHDCPDVVAHRNGTGWQVHVVYSYASSPSDGWYYRRGDISSGGSITWTGQTALGLNYGNYVHKYPSIDFHHTGDGKTIKDGTPHLYVAWSAGATGSGKGIRFRKATYSGGTWTWGTEREIDSTRYASDASSRWLNCLFDGTRVVIGGQLIEADGYNDIVLYDRDPADTATTTRVLLNGSSANNVVADYLHSGSLAYNGNGDIYLFGVDRTGANGSRSFYYRKWTRATASLGAHVVIDASTPDYPYVSAKRGYSNNRIEFIYTDGSASPYNVTYGGIK